jgi:hypothetical protein
MAEKFPSWKQALITFIGGFVLAGSTCFGFLATLGNLEHSDGGAVSSVMAIGFGLSLLIILVGFVLVLMRIIRAMTEKGQSTGASPPPLPPPDPGASA